MRRDEVVELIERLQSTPKVEDERFIDLEKLRFETAESRWPAISLSATWRRGAKYGWLLICGLGRVSKQDQRRFRFVERAVGGIVSFFAYLIASFVIFELAIMVIHSLNPGLFGGFFWAIAINVSVGTVPLMLSFRGRSVPYKFEQKNFQAIRPWCIGCGYELEGLDSVLGDELWVGPTVCPECGQEYPAVGE